MKNKAPRPIRTSPAPALSKNMNPLIYKLLQDNEQLQSLQQQNMGQLHNLVISEPDSFRENPRLEVL